MFGDPSNSIRRALNVKEQYLSDITIIGILVAMINYFACTMTRNVQEKIFEQWNGADNSK